MSKGPLEPFIDIPGASGALYRFRKVQDQPPAMACNFVYVREHNGAARIVGCGKARTLADAVAIDVKARGQEGQLYVRLNVSGAKRDAEHADIAAVLPEPFVVYEME